MRREYVIKVSPVHFVDELQRIQADAWEITKSGALSLYTLDANNQPISLVRCYAPGMWLAFEQVIGEKQA